MIAPMMMPMPRPIRPKLVVAWAMTKPVMEVAAKIMVAIMSQRRRRMENPRVFL